MGKEDNSNAVVEGNGVDQPLMGAMRQLRLQISMMLVARTGVPQPETGRYSMEMAAAILEIPQCPVYVTADSVDAQKRRCDLLESLGGLSRHIHPFLVVPKPNHGPTRRVVAAEESLWQRLPGTVLPIQSMARPSALMNH
jgi:hypothetical protein